MPRSKKRKPIRVEEAGVTVRLFQRGSQWWGDVRLDDGRKRVPLDTTVRATAEDHARAFAREIATRQLTGVTPDTLTLSQLFQWYRGIMPTLLNKKRLFRV